MNASEARKKTRSAMAKDLWSDRKYMKRSIEKIIETIEEQIIASCAKQQFMCSGLGKAIDMRASEIKMTEKGVNILTKKLVKYFEKKGYKIDQFLFIHW